MAGNEIANEEVGNEAGQHDRRAWAANAVRRGFIPFAAGVIAAHLLVAPIAAVPAFLAVAGVVLFAKRTRWLCGLAIGVAWGTVFVQAAIVQPISFFASVAAHQAMQQAMQRDLGGEDCGNTVTLVGTVTGLPRVEDKVVRFEFDARLAATRCSLASNDSPAGSPDGRVRLVWAFGPRLVPGETWRIDARLRAPRGFVNQVGFDYERWMTRRRLVASGYVIDGRRLSAADMSIDGFRQRVGERVAGSALPGRGIVLALSTGDTSGLTASDWNLFRDSATVHLLVISGLHVGMFAAVGLVIGNGLARLTPLTRRFRARACGTVCASLSVLAYAMLSGASLPVVRAAIMAAVFLLAYVAGRHVAASLGITVALVAVLLLDPMAPLDQGFWLSFGAVAALLGYFAPRVDTGPRQRIYWRALGRAQFVVWVGLAPLLSLFTGQLNLLAPITNMVMIPLVTLVVVPLSVAGVTLLMLIESAGVAVLRLADQAIELVRWLLMIAEGVGVLQAGQSLAGVAGASILALTFVLPTSALVKLAGALGILAIAAAPATSSSDAPGQPIPNGEFRVTVLDVGQGSSTIVETRHHVLVHDVGARFPSGFDLGTAAVVPAVRVTSSREVTTLILSHADIDHVGGAASVIANLDVRRVLAGESVAGIDARRCERGDGWLWDGVWFRVLHPPPRRPDGPDGSDVWQGGSLQGDSLEGNDASCVVLIGNGKHNVLLPGDIHAASERGLDLPPITLIVVPHHGSKTSSHRAFVRRLGAEVAVFSAGFANRFGHPHADVQERYRNIGAHLVSTAASGAVVWSTLAPGEVRRQRCQGRGYWRAGGRLSIRNASQTQQRKITPINRKQSRNANMLPCR
ncbi:MAG: DNA internalization-related competence protein ComEC/Rec2 [Gammaproteobacteria bacterium]|nr:DNA internalization-related competence protein ComEC/Rec2 [Gammaproteobacteria bacterium]